MKVSTIVLIFIVGAALAFWGYRVRTGSAVTATPPGGTPPVTEEEPSPPGVDDTSTPTPTGTPTPTPTALTPYVTVFSRYYNCREEPATSAPLVDVITGQQVNILAQQDGWLHVAVAGFADECWVFSEVIVDLEDVVLTVIPTYAESAAVLPTFTLPFEDKSTGTPTRHPDGDDTPYPTETRRGPTGTPPSTETSRPTDIARPTATPRPTETPRPTPTPCTNKHGHIIPCPQND